MVGAATVSAVRQFAEPSFANALLVIVGGYGSGKSEISVNLARYLAVSQPDPVSIADLDLVNPYFRSREALEQLNSLGVKVIAPQGDMQHADLPIVMPEIRGAIGGSDGPVILDVGGDDVGSRVLSSLGESLSGTPHDMLFVHNAGRPFTADVANSLRMIEEIQHAANLEITGIISNTHMMDHTTSELILEGLVVAKKTAESVGVPVVFTSMERRYLEKLHPDQVDTAVLILDRDLLKPWERPQLKGKPDSD
jgi:hypothetical protein